MREPNILLTRIDNRLVHGQVGVVWTSSLGANLLVVADDETAASPLQQELMTATAESSEVGIRFFTLQRTIDIIHKASRRQKIFIVVKTPDSAKTLIEGGVPIKELNVGNMHYAKGKDEITKKVYMDAHDKETLKTIAAGGVNVFIQDVPSDKKIYIKEVL